MEGKTNRLPLSGYRVLELGSTVAGPFCGRLFADFGAEVIKVELPDGDPLRTMGSHKDGVSLYAASIFRNKSLVALDLRKPEGRRLARELALKCDVLVENFRPGTLERWGLGYEELSAVNPRLVMVSISGYGQTGPYRMRPGYGVIGEAVSGLRHITGDPDRPPARVSTSLSDYIAGLYAAFGAVMALNLRERTGRGQLVDAALSECAFSFMEPHVPAFDQLGIVANRTGSSLPGTAPNNLYRTRDAQFIHVAVVAESIFLRLCAVMQKPGLADDPRYSSARARVTHAADIDAELQSWIGGLELAEVERLLHDADVPAARIYTVKDIFADPHFLARGMLARVPVDGLGEVAVANVVPKLSATPGELHTGGGRVGRDTGRVLADWLALSEEAIAALEKDETIFCAQSA